MSNRDRKKREQARRRPSPAPSRPQRKPSFITRLHTHAAIDDIHRQVVEASGPLLRQGDDPAAPGRAAQAARDIALKVVEHSPRSGRHACAAGCAFCCHTALSVSPPEAFAIMDYLRAHIPPGELVEVRRRAEANVALAAQLTRGEYLRKLVRCALLTDDGNCRVHPVRPLACAGYLSTSRDACEAEFNRVAGRAAVPVDEQAMFGVLAAARGLEDACDDAGLDSEGRELHHMLLRLWDDPGAGQAWRTGALRFDDCLPVQGW